MIDALYNKYRIYATEAYRLYLKGDIKPKSNLQIKKEYEVPMATSRDTSSSGKGCFMTPAGLMMLSDPEYRNILNSFLLDYLSMLCFDSVLEVGCGSGRNLLSLSKLFPDTKLYGLDVSSQCIKEANETGINANLMCCSAEKIPLDDNSVDVVLSVHALEQMNNILPSVVDEVCRVSSHAVVFFEPFYSFQNVFGRMHNQRLNYPRLVPKLVSEHGFEVSVFRDLCFGNPANRTGVLVAIKGKKEVTPA